MPATTFDAIGTVRSIGSFQVTQTLTSQRQTTLGDGKSFRRRSAAATSRRRVQRQRNQRELIADVLRQPALRYSGAPQKIAGRTIGTSRDYAMVRDSLAYPGPEQHDMLGAVQYYHESGLADNMMMSRSLGDAQNRSSTQLQGQNRIVSTRSRHDLDPEALRQSSFCSSPDRSSNSLLVPNDRGHAMSTRDRAPPPSWALGLLAPTGEYTAEARQARQQDGPTAPTVEDLDLRSRRSKRLTMPSYGSPAAGSWHVLRKAVGPVASHHVMERMSVGKGDGLAQPSLTHSKGPRRSTAVARKSLVQRWAYDAEANLAKFEAAPHEVTFEQMGEVTEQLAGALRAKVLAPGPLLRAQRAHRRAEAWLEELRPPPVISKQDFSVLRDLTKAVANLRMKGAAVSNGNEEAIRQTFNELDVDNSGSLDYDEVARLADKLGKPVDEETMAKAVKLMDQDGDGVVDFGEFLAWWRLGLSGTDLSTDLALSRPSSAHSVSSGSWAGTSSRPHSAVGV